MTNIGSNTIIIGGSPVIEIDNVNTKELELNLQNVPIGYYRLYVNNNNNLYWENLIIDNQIKYIVL